MKDKNNQKSIAKVLILCMGLIIALASCGIKEASAPSDQEKPETTSKVEEQAHETEEQAQEVEEQEAEEPEEQDVEPQASGDDDSGVLTGDELYMAVYMKATEEPLTENEIANIDGFFQSYTISYDDPVYSRITGKSYQDNTNIGLDSLRYLRIPHYDFNHEVRLGEMIVNVGIADSALAIFRTLFDNEYEINSIRLIDDFWAGDGLSSDDASIAANNTSAFCYREIAGGTGLSNHAYGRAIDVNPYQNPYYRVVNGEPTDLFEWDWDYLDRESGKPHMILRGDICQATFAAYGFTWGGDWADPVDYQHFELP